jgi:asparagine synthase (glutamine-hydrolysing)
MCGFAGYTGNDTPQVDAVAVLRRMARYLSPRGPDDEAAIRRPTFRVVFRRLSVNDLENGRQPFITSDGRFVIVVNGEIYNHVELRRQFLSDVTFVTRSDCEVVLHLFLQMGSRCLRELNGMYALAIWDEQERRLLLARDRLGIKPLYYAQVGEELLFASELKALLVHPDAPRTLDWRAFRHVRNSVFPFERPAGRPVRSGIEDVFFLEPASFLEWRDGRIRIQRKYWTPPTPADRLEGITSPRACVERYADLIEDSVRLQLRSDVPVGLFLSGGLDSSLIAGIAHRYGQTPEAFTLVEPSIEQTGDPQAALEVSQRFGLPLHKVRVDWSALASTLEISLETFEYFIWIMDLPMFNVEFLFKHELHRRVKAIRPEMKVILLGQGADEFAGGYSPLVGGTWRTFAEAEARAFHAARLDMAPADGVFLDEPSAEESPSPSSEYEPWQLLRFGDLAAYNLWHEDRTAAANGAEARVPFLDHRLVEFLCSIPIGWREELFFDKAIERRASLRFLPSELACRPKVPLYMTGRGRDGSVVLIRRMFSERVFPAFREKYLEPGDALLARPDMQALCDEAARFDHDGALDVLYRCMAICVFERICRDIQSTSFEPPILRSARPPLGTGIQGQGGMPATTLTGMPL